MNIQPHNDDDQISAHLDGEADPAGAGHLRSCPECQGRLARLREVASLVGTDVALPPAEVRDAALAAASRAWADEQRGEVAATAPAVVSLGERRRLPRWALPVAAAAAALLVAVPVIGSITDGPDRTATTATAGREAGEGAGTEVAAADGGDLGDQSDPTVLATALRGALPGAGTAVAATDAAAPGAPESLRQEAPAGGLAAPNTPPEAEAQAAKKAAKPFVDPPCAGTARSSYGKGLGPLLFAARLQWQGAPAVVLAFKVAEAGAPGLDYRVLVMAREDCRLLVVQSL